MSKQLEHEDIENTSPSVEEPKVIIQEETSTTIEELKDLEGTLLSDADLEDLKNNPPYEGELEALLKEIENDKEPNETQDLNYSCMDYPIPIFKNHNELESQPVPMPPYITLPNSFSTENSKNLSESHERVQKYCLSTPITDITISDSDSDDSQKPSLKRKRYLNTPSNTEEENTVKTMKPEPESKTKNIDSDQETINEVNQLEIDPSMDFFYTDSDNDSYSDENESDALAIDSLTDDEVGHIEPDVTEFTIAYNEAAYSSHDSAKEENQW